MPNETAYNFGISNAGLAGMIADIGNTDIDSFAAEAAIPFGIFVSRGTDPENQVIVGDAAAIGVSIRDAKENSLPAGVYDGGSYEITETVGVMRSGYIWCQFDQAGGVVGDPVSINAQGIAQADPALPLGAVALTGIKATVEKPAVDATNDATGIFVGLVKIEG